MDNWIEYIRYEPIRPFSSTQNDAIKYFVRKDLLEEEVESVEFLWKLPKTEKILKKQHDGSWKYPRPQKDIRTQNNYNQLETYRQLGFLIEKYGFKNKHQAIRGAAEFLFSFQTEEGDFRGIYGNQYSPNYSAGIMELLIKAGYDKDPRIEKGLNWLLSIRQNDGGWAIPIRTNNAKWSDVENSKDILQPNKRKPFSHMITGIILRAFAAHPKYRKNEEVKVAGELLASRFFKPDKYPDRKGVEYWFSVSFPFWWTDIVSSLDTLYYLGFTSSHPKIEFALNTLRNKQLENGLWDLKLLKTRDKDLPLWISLAICRIFKNFY
ncbi:MAG: hypothetical protein ACFE9N_11715 [Promethearchaeota archaeon]